MLSFYIEVTYTLWTYLDQLGSNVIVEGMRDQSNFAKGAFTKRLVLNQIVLHKSEIAAGKRDVQNDGCISCCRDMSICMMAGSMQILVDRCAGA